VPVEQERQGNRTIMGRVKCGPAGQFFKSHLELIRPCPAS
jgi:hypothetical protein